jgi:hypothetical protein
MILREATRADLRPAAECCQAVWTKINNPTAAEGAVERFETLQDKGIRLFVLWHEGKVEAVVGGPRMSSTRGLGYKVTLLVVNLEHPDRLELLDAIVLYCMNILMSEGYHVIHTVRPKSETGPFYGRDFLGMEEEDFAHELWYWGESKEMMERIYERHPEWRQLP